MTKTSAWGAVHGDNGRRPSRKKYRNWHRSQDGSNAGHRRCEKPVPNTSEELQAMEADGYNTRGLVRGRRFWVITFSPQTYRGFVSIVPSIVIRYPATRSGLPPRQPLSLYRGSPAQSRIFRCVRSHNLSIPGVFRHLQGPRNRDHVWDPR